MKISWISRARAELLSTTAGLLIACLLPNAVRAEMRYTWMPLKANFLAVDINSSGVAVGVYSHPEYGDTVAHQYVNGIASSLSVHGYSSWADAINDAGQIVGSRYEFPWGPRIPFIYENGKVSDVGDGYSSVWDINNNGEVLGSRDADGQNRMFLYRDGAITFLDHAIAFGITPVSLTDSGQILFTNTRNNTAYIYDEGNITPIAFAGQAMNSAGAVAGTARVDDGSGVCCSRAVLYQDGATVDLGTLPTLESSFASDINNMGQVVGWSADPGLFYGTNPRAFLYENSQMIDLTSITNFSSGPFVRILRATSIADSGHIVALGCEREVGPDCEVARWGILRPVPEPGSAAMMLAGFALLGIYIRKTMSKTAARVLSAV